MPVKVRTREELNKALNEKQKEIIIDNNQLANELIRWHKLKKVIFIASIVILTILCIIIFTMVKELPLIITGEPPTLGLGLPPKGRAEPPTLGLGPLPKDWAGPLFLIGFVSIY